LALALLVFNIVQPALLNHAGLQCGSVYPYDLPSAQAYNSYIYRTTLVIKHARAVKETRFQIFLLLKNE